MYLLFGAISKFVVIVNTAHIYLPSWRTWKHNKRTHTHTQNAPCNFRFVFIGSAVKCVGFIVLLACMVIIVDCMPANECAHNEQEKAELMGKGNIVEKTSGDTQKSDLKEMVKS